MEANSRPLMRIFEPTVCYQIPLFQRPYVWRREGNWQPLWDDLERLLGLALAGQKLRPLLLLCSQQLKKAELLGAASQA